MNLDRWTPPEPTKLPAWRSSMLDHMESMQAKVTMAHAIASGHSTVMPMVAGMSASPASVGAALLTAAEAHRLRHASLYYASPDMTALTLAASRTRPTEPVSIRRLPSPAGLIVFAEPIGGYETDAAKALAGTRAYRPGASAIVTTPIVAASWSTWSPSSVSLDRGRVRWLYRSGDRNALIPDDFQGIWVTFYSPRGLFSGLAPETVIGSMADGSPMTARDIDGRRETDGPVLAWDNEMLMKTGGRFEEPKPDTNAAWGIALYTAWQLMTQVTKTETPWVDVEEVPRSRSGVKRDGHQGITGSSAVRIINVHSTHRPSRSAADRDAADSTGRREPKWSCRWPVEPYRRNTCLNTGAHADGGCTHEDRIVPGHIKGPKGLPLRTRETVRVWDSQPGA
ncbi:hypothetical protein [Streptomyces sp. AMCC400023]|uniref:hypothetical protein n=1 Tax=Streptomyces sp. AMCC400023 TaxID=2056258 RepID=UPI001F469733|nr:hypothetical protein [Streptomyces sp. AMCC400023]UJV42962.1 hypothetical protein CVT30_26745 [Streptomyces sp. AMCC400023]